MNRLLTFTLFLLPVSLFSQPVCDSLDVISLKYAPFADTMLEVEIRNYNTSTFFDYPGFILLDSQGDTVAKEQVNWFVLGNHSLHLLDVWPGMPTSGIFEGQLEFWSGFYTTKHCTWTDTVRLCPSSCRTIYLAFMGWGIGTPHPDVDWSLLDSNGQTVATGTFVLSDSVQAALDSVCLEPGEYTFKLDTASNLGGNPYMIISSPLWSGQQLQTLYDINDPTLSFELYGACIDKSTGIEETRGELGNIRVFSGEGFIKILGDMPFDRVEIYDLSGRLVSAKETKSLEVDLKLADRVTGIYLVLVRTQEGMITRKVWYGFGETLLDQPFRL